MCSLASGLAIGISADAGTRAVGAQSAMSATWKKMGFTGDSGGGENSNSDSLFVGTVLIQVFAGNLGLYGLIVALILSQVSNWLSPILNTITADCTNGLILPWFVSLAVYLRSDGLRVWG